MPKSSPHSKPRKTVTVPLVSPYAPANVTTRIKALMKAGTKSSDGMKKEVGSRIRKKRFELNMLQSDLAKKLDVHRTHVSEWETGRCALRIEQAMAMADVLNTTVGFLAGESDD